MRVESARNLFAVIYVASVASVVSTLDGLPELVASSFGGGGAAQAFMSRRAYGVFFSSFTALLPLILVAAFSWLPRRSARFVNVPHRERWLAPEFREVLFRRLGFTGYFVAGAAALFLAAMHTLVAEANTHTPPRLAQAPFIALLLAFLACTVGSALGLGLSLRRGPTRDARD